MPVNLGGWGWAVGLAIDFGAPILGTAFGVPGLAGQAGQLLKRALGLSPNVSEETVKATVEADPEAAKAAFQSANTEAAAKWEYLARAEEARAKVNIENVSQVNKTIREETAKGVSWWHWRHLIGYLVLLYGFVLIAIMVKAAFFPVTGGTAVNDLVNLFNATTAFTLGLFGLLGYVAQDSTALKTAAITNQPVPGILSTAMKGITGGKK